MHVSIIKLHLLGFAYNPESINEKATRETVCIGFKYKPDSVNKKDLLHVQTRIRQWERLAPDLVEKTCKVTVFESEPPLVFEMHSEPDVCARGSR